MVRNVERVTRRHSHWRKRVDIKANKSLFRKLTRKRIGVGRKFSPERFDDVVLGPGLDFLFYTSKETIPQTCTAKRSDPVNVIITKESKSLAQKIENHLRTSGYISFCTNISQFQMENLRFILKLIDHEDTICFMESYMKADNQTTQDVIDFLQAHVDKYHVEESD